jgi:pimeloyl-ACP methyl ester carboxylesterase
MAYKDIFRYFREDHDEGHSKSSAYLLALLCHYVYDGRPPGKGPFESDFTALVQALSATDMFEVMTFTEAGPFPYDTEAVVLSNARLILVVFRGTEGAAAFRDWLTNGKHLMHACPASWGSVKAHRGFYNALSTVYQGVRNEVRSRRTNDQKVFLAGHSLGGALATLCAYRFEKVGGVPVTGVYVFGSPRVGDIAFANAYKDLLGSRTFRWVKNLDFASKLPVFAGAPLPSTQYHHVGQLNFINAKGKIEMDAVDSNPGLGYNTTDHDMPAYVKVMQSRLSTVTRKSATDPDYLVRGDVPATGLY